MINARQYRFLVAWDETRSILNDEFTFLVQVGYIAFGQITPSGRAAMREYEEAVLNA